MTATAAADLAPWQRRAYEHAAQALDGNRMGHALLLCGPARLGKGEVARLLARRLRRRCCRRLGNLTGIVVRQLFWFHGNVICCPRVAERFGS